MNNLHERDDDLWKKASLSEIKRLIELDPNALFTLSGGHLPISRAVYGGSNEDVVKELFNKNKDSIFWKDKNTNRVMLHDCVFLNHIHLVPFLLSAHPLGVYNKRNGLSAMPEAESLTLTNIRNKLKKHKSELYNVKEAPLDVAVRENHTEIVRLLSTPFKTVIESNNFQGGNTMFHYAAAFCVESILLNTSKLNGMLLQFDGYPLNDWGETPLHMLCKNPFDKNLLHSLQAMIQAVSMDKSEVDKDDWMLVNAHNITPALVQDKNGKNFLHVMFDKTFSQTEYEEISSILSFTNFILVNYPEMAKQLLVAETVSGKTPLHILCEQSYDKLKVPSDEIQEAHFKLVKVVYNSTSTEYLDYQGRTRNILCSFICAWPKPMHWAKTLNALYGRYKVGNLDAPVHKSATCVIYYGIDILTSDPTAKKVVLKVMNKRVEFLRELLVRYRSRSSSSFKECVAQVLGWHLPPDGAELSKNITKQLVIDLERPQSTNSNEEYVLVLEQGSCSLFNELSSRRIAGIDVSEVRALFSQITECVLQMHQTGFIHNDLKPRNILRMKSNKIKLCDLDATLQKSQMRDKTIKCSTAYIAPECARFYLGDGSVPVASESIDIWGLGVILFELCAGQHLFSQDISDDNMVNLEDKSRLCTWHTIDDDKLNLTFANEESMCTDQERRNAKHLIRWCLKGNPGERPSIGDIQSHPFLKESTAPISADNDLLKMKYHVFISHSQTEASGDVGTLFHLLEEMGVHGWRDMNQTNLTVEGMKTGVHNSDLFILFLTNNALSRNFCQAEIKWAIDYCKPIIVVNETDDRFYPWDYQRWKTNKCTKVSGANDWTHGWLQSTYEETSKNQTGARVVEFIEKQYASHSMIPFRRRDFEASSMIKTIIRRAGKMGCLWGNGLPQLRASKPKKKVKVAFVYAPGIGVKLYKELMQSWEKNTTFDFVEVNDFESASKCLVILTSNLLQNLKSLQRFVGIYNSQFGQGKRFNDIVFIYLNEGEFRWRFDLKIDVYLQQICKEGLSLNQTSNKIANSIQNHECIVYRPLDPVSTTYEHIGMSKEIFRRFH